MSLGGIFRPIAAGFARAGASATSRGRAIGAAVSTFFVGTWSARRAVFESVPRDMRTTDPTRASEFIEGYIALGDRVVELRGASLFSIDPPSPLFAKALHSFEWLRHLRAYDLSSLSTSEAQRIAAGHARKLTLEWMAKRQMHPRLARTPQLCARRALSLTNHAAFLLDEAEPIDYRRIMAGILRDTQFAFTRRALIADPTERCFAMLACASVAFALKDHLALKAKTKDALSEALKEAFLPDGGPTTRRPADLTILLPEMIALRALMESRGAQVPNRLHTSIDRGLRMLRMLRHPDGTLARFQGTDSIAALESDLVASVLFYDTQRSEVPITAPASGYARLDAGKSTVLADCGAPPPPEASTQAHASALAFEWSFGGTKIITSAPEIGYTIDVDIRGQRRTHAHSTVIVGNTSSAKFSGGREHAPLLRGNLNVDIKKSEEYPTREITLRHTGYRQSFGMDHERSLNLSDNGRILEGHDRLLTAKGTAAPANRQSFAAHFQLQPGARIKQEADRRLRITFKKEVVVFEADSGILSVEDPTDRPSYRGPARAKRLVLDGPTSGPAELRWRFIVQYAGASTDRAPSAAQTDDAERRDEIGETQEASPVGDENGGSSPD